ncbi:MAG: 1-deoxy-D-xylulose-5-phosphate synthase [Rikenellaceae bacterium]
MVYKYLDNINSPDDLKKLTIDELPQYCDEIRHFIIEQLSSNPGHLGSSLGAVELAVAIHYVYDTPFDNLIWDVGHQAYAHKIITGRRDIFNTNRKLNGISGFPRRCESEYDAFSGGHASVSVSAALGMDVANHLAKGKKKNVAVIGDGSLTGGLAFEGMNNAGVLAEDLLVILNDNDMSIDPNVGALKDYLLQISISPHYNKAKQYIKRQLKKIPHASSFVNKLFTGLKSFFFKSGNLFEALSFRYFGTVDGHDVKNLVYVLRDMRQIPKAKLLHVLTKKGKGYEPAEESQTTWHAPGKFDYETGKRNSVPTESLKYQDVFGKTLVELAKMNDKIVGVTPAMPSGCSMIFMQREIPDRVFDVGIAEGHAVTFSGGMATQGLHPFCNIYSSFMQRAYDNVIHDIILQGVDVTLCLDRAGVVGEDGATHHGVFDISYFRCVPHITIASPMNEQELRNMMYSSQLGSKGAYLIRYPRGCGAMGKNWQTEFQEIPTGRSRVVSEGTDIALLTFGDIGNVAARAAARASEVGISVKHVDMRFVKPLDEAMLHEIGTTFSKVITVEDGVLKGGFGSAILEFFSDNGYSPRVCRLGIPDNFVQHGKISELMAIYGYDEAGIYKALTTF